VDWWGFVGVAERAVEMNVNVILYTPIRKA
jgi:hypothetical protein